MNESKSVPRDAEASNFAGLICRYDKHKSSSDAPMAMDWIKAVYDDAIEYTGMPKSLRGALLMMGVAFGLGGGGVILWCGVDGLLYSRYPEGNVLGGVASVGALTFILYMVLSSCRLELFSPEDAPTLFDRKHRKVYRISRDSKLGFKGLFQRWPLTSDAYDWNLIDGEHRAELVTTGTTAYRQHSLVLTVRRSVDDPTVVEEFQLGNALVLSDDLADGVWEHLRRYMEENGPPLPPGQGLADRSVPQSWWESMGAVGTFGPNYFEHWRNRPVMTLIEHICIVVFLPMNLLWGTGNWLSYKTMVPVVWPREVAQAVGPRRQG